MSKPSARLQRSVSVAHHFDCQAWKCLAITETCASFTVIRRGKKKRSIFLRFFLGCNVSAHACGCRLACNSTSGQGGFVQVTVILIVGGEGAACSPVKLFRVSEVASGRGALSCKLMHRQCSGWGDRHELFRPWFQRGRGIEKCLNFQASMLKRSDPASQPERTRWRLRAGSSQTGGARV